MREKQTLRLILFAMAFLIVRSGNAQVASPSADPTVTPRELIVQLSDDRDLTTESALAAVNRRWRLESAARIVEPRPGSHPLRKPLERTWTLRFSRDVPLDAVQRDYAALSVVRWAEANRLYPTLADETIPNDPEWAELWNLQNIGMPAAWAIERGDPSVIVAIVDTGSTLDHPDLEGQLWTNPGEIPDNGRDDDGNGFADDTYGWDFVHAPTTAGSGDFQEPDNDPSDETGHGTHVSGILLARPDNGLGIAGVAWGCRLMVVRTGFAARGGGGTFLQEDDSAAGIVYAAENGASVINMSWGDDRGSSLLRDTLRYADALGVVLVGATGNDNLTEIVYPGAFPEVIAVAASGRDGEAAYFTSGNPEADIAAPGVSVLSLHIDGGLRVLSGTSMAAPHVAGVAALMLAKRPALTPEEVRRFLVSTAEPLTLERIIPGVGKLNAPNALQANESLIAELDADLIPLGADQALTVIGSVGGPRYAGYRLSLGESEVPTSFHPIHEASGVESAGTRRALFEWDTTALNEGVYALRLEAYDTDGNVARDQRLITVDHTPPRLEEDATRHPLFVSALARGETRLLGWSETDDDAFTTVDFFDPQTGEMRATFETSTPRRQFAYDVSDALPNGVWAYEYRARNRAGLERVITGEADTTVRRPNPNNRTRFGGSNLPSLDVAPKTVDFNGNGLMEIVGSTPGTEGFLFTQIFEMREGVGLRSVHIFPEFFTPLDVGDLDGDGLLEVLGQQADGLVIYEAAEPNAFPTERIWTGAGLTRGRYLDLDNDGRTELIARKSASVLAVVQSVEDNRFAEPFGIRNPTEGRNFFTPNVAVVDVRGGRELFVGDADGDLIGFRFDGSALTPVFDQRLRHSRLLDIAAVADGRLAILAQNDFGSTPRSGRLNVLALYEWENGAPAKFGVAGGSTPYIQRLRDADDDASLTVDSDGASPSVGVVSAAWAYLLEQRDGLELVWSAPATQTSAPAFLDLTGDGSNEFLFNTQGFLGVVTAQPSSTRDVAPYGLTAAPLDEQRVRLTWETPDPSRPVDIYRAVNGGEPTRLATATETGEYVDATAQVGSVFRYEIGFEDVRSNPASVFIGRQPSLIDAEAITPSRVRLRFSEPMGPSARRAERYLVTNAVDSQARWRATSVLGSGPTQELTMTMDGELPAGSYRVQATDPSQMRSDEFMPLKEGAAFAFFEVAASDGGPADLNRLRVYPNPAYVSRNHAARVRFDRLPDGSDVRIYTLSGDLIAKGRAAELETAWTWDLLNGSFDPVSPGVYVYTVEWNGTRRVGKIAVVR